MAEQPQTFRRVAQSGYTEAPRTGTETGGCESAECQKGNAEMVRMAGIANERQMPFSATPFKLCPWCGRARTEAGRQLLTSLAPALAAPETFEGVRFGQLLEQLSLEVQNDSSLARSPNGLMRALRAMKRTAMRASDIQTELTAAKARTETLEKQIIELNGQLQGEATLDQIANLEARVAGQKNAILEIEADRDQLKADLEKALRELEQFRAPQPERVDKSVFDELQQRWKELSQAVWGGPIGSTVEVSEIVDLATKQRQRKGR